MHPVNYIPDISAIIVTYNSGEDLHECLSSLTAALRNFRAEIIVIDNYSTDNTIEVIHSFQKQYSFISFIKNEENFGYTWAINQGLSQVRGRYILTLNPDTVIPESAFDTLILEFDVDPKIGIVSPQFLNSDHTIQRSCRRFPRHRDVLFHMFGLNSIAAHSRLFNGWKMGDFDHASREFVDQPQGAFLFCRSSAYRDVGLYDMRFPMFFSDVDWCRRFRDAGWQILFTPAVKIIHHQGRSIHKRRIPMIWSSHKSFYNYFQKYYSGGLWTFINWFTGLALFIMALLRTMYILTIRSIRKITRRDKS